MKDNFFEPIEPFNVFKLNVSNLHTIHVEESGNKNGKPVIFLHGGPGGGTEPIYRQYFDPKKLNTLSGKNNILLTFQDHLLYEYMPYKVTFEYGFVT